MPICLHISSLPPVRLLPAANASPIFLQPVHQMPELVRASHLLDTTAQLVGKILQNAMSAHPRQSMSSTLDESAGRF